MRDETEIDRADAAGPLTGAYRLIRRVAPPESPFEGMLAKVNAGSADGAEANSDSRNAAGSDDDTAVVLVDAECLAHWAGWSEGGEQHVVGPLDIARRARGHDVVMPWCLERVEAFVGRRSAASSPLSGGEVVTVAVSVLRGSAEVWRVLEGSAQGPGQGPSGSWWLTDAGRPMFVHAIADEGEPIEMGAALIIRSLASSCDDRTVVRLLEKAAVMCEKPRHLSRVIDEWEGHFFAVSAPRPLATTVFPAARARELAVPSLRPDADGATSSPAVGRLRDVISRHIDADLGDLVAVRVSGTLKSIRARLGKGHRLPWLAAGAVAALIVVGGVLWPSDDSVVSAAQAPGATASAEAAAVADASTPAAVDPEPLEPDLSTPEAPAPNAPAPDVPAPDVRAPDVPGTELVGEAGRLLDSLAVCRASGDEAQCLTAITETPGLNPSPGAIDLAASDRVLTLVDDYGGAGLVQVAPNNGAATAQLVVIVERQDKWLLRDVYDVAKQPD